MPIRSSDSNISCACCLFKDIEDHTTPCNFSGAGAKPSKPPRLHSPRENQLRSAPAGTRLCAAPPDSGMYSVSFGWVIQGSTHYRSHDVMAKNVIRITA